jgi:uncharacterized protein (DUF427 family)
MTTSHPSPPSRRAGGAVYHEPTAKRIRAVLAGRTIVDTVSARLVWEHQYYPQYYLPEGDVADGVLTGTETTSEREGMGPARHYTVRVGDREVVDGAWQYPEAEGLESFVRFRWDSADSWFEEDEEVFVHPRSPYVRVDIQDSGRRIRVEIDGVTVAESSRPKLLFETGLPTRYYLPKVDVRLDLLTPTETSTACPYKGTARYWTATVNGTDHEDIVWGYDAPLAESVEVAGMMCFYSEKVDLFVDGEPDG